LLVRYFLLAKTVGVGATVIFIAPSSGWAGFAIVNVFKLGIEVTIPEVGYVALPTLPLIVTSSPISSP
jgi:hypothetical protein